MTKYRITKIYPNCKPGGRGFTGKNVDAVLEVPAGQHLLAHGQIVEVEDILTNKAAEMFNNCPACNSLKFACKATPECIKAVADRNGKRDAEAYLKAAEIAHKGGNPWEPEEAAKDLWRV